MDVLEENSPGATAAAAAAAVNGHSSTGKSKANQIRPVAVGDIKKDLYAAAAECLDAVVKERASVKSAIYNSPFEDKRVLMAITQKTVDKLQHLKPIIYDAQILIKEPRLTKSMAYVIAFDMLFGEMSKPRGIARLMSKFQDDLKASLSKYLTKNNVTDVTKLRLATTLKAFVTPRYVRVNRLKASVEDVVSALEKEKFHLTSYDADNISQKTYINMLRRFKPSNFLMDFHVPDLLVFHPTVFFHEHELEKSGKIVLQDKASCLPSLLLNPPPGSTVIDACAAPGMKTSHLAALMENKGQIYAVDIHETRSQTMKTLLAHYGVTCAEVVNMDFMKISPDDEKYSPATHILVDPTCTGSGVTKPNRKSKKKTKKGVKEDKQRLQKLQGLQVTLLKHALSFPNVQRVVYSTCSINPEEDEQVVQEAVKSFASQFVVRPYSKYLPKWRGCGKTKYAGGQNCLRAFPEKHLTNGFFVAVIERFTAVDAEAAQTQVSGINGEETVDVSEKKVNLDNSVGEEDVDVTPASSGKKSRRRKKRNNDQVSEHWSAADASSSSKKQKI